MSLSHLSLLLQMPFLLSIHSDGEVLRGMQCRITGADLVGVKGPLYSVPLLCCIQHLEVGFLNHLYKKKRN